MKQKDRIDRPTFALSQKTKDDLAYYGAACTFMLSMSRVAYNQSF